MRHFIAMIQKENNKTAIGHKSSIKMKSNIKKSHHPSNNVLV